MASTKWGFIWGGPPSNPTLWGGSADEVIEAPDADASRIAASSLWMARDDSAGVVTDPNNVVAATVVGYVPNTNNMPRFHPPGDFTCIVTKEAAVQSVRIVRSSQAGSLELSNDSTEDISQIHTTLRPSQAVTGTVAGFTNAAGFVGIIDTSPAIDGWFFPLSQIDGENPIVPFKSTLWDNELGVSTDQIRVVDILRVSHGPLLIISDASKLYLKSTWGSGPSNSAVELEVDLAFDDYVPDASMSRFHVVVTNNDVLVIYYAVTRTNGERSTAVLAYRPMHGTQDNDLPFDEDGVICRPKIIRTGLVPTVSHTGAMRHQVSSDILVALQSVDSGGAVEDPNIHWMTTRGLGTVLEPVADVWDETTHPNLFGGKARLGAQTREIDLISIGWSGNRQESLFFVVGSMTYNATVASYSEYENTYATGSQSEAQSTKRLCLGEVWVVTESETNAGGKHSLGLVHSVAFRTNKQDRQGYDANAVIAGEDLFNVKSILSMTLESGNQVPAVVGPEGSTGGTSVFPIAGMVKNGGLNFPTGTSKVTIPGSETFRGDSVCLSIWVYPTLGGDATNENLVHMEGVATPAFQLRWDISAQVFRWSVTVTSGVLNIDSTIPTYTYAPGRWYHVTALYNHELEHAQLYVFGILVAESVASGGDVLVQHPTTNHPVILGSVSPTVQSVLSRMDNPAFGFDAVKPQEVVAAFFHGLGHPVGPVRLNRFNDPTTQDFVFATASIAKANGTVYTVCARQINPSIEVVFRYQVVFDVWRLNRGEEEIPQYMGTVAPPQETMDLFHDDTHADVYTQSTWTVNDVSMFEITLLEEFDTNLELTGNLVLFAPFTGAESASPGNNKTTIWRVEFDPDAPLLGSSSGTRHRIVCVIPISNDFKCMTAVSRKKLYLGVHSEAVFIALETSSEEQVYEIRVLETQIFGTDAFDFATIYPLENIVPPPDTTGSFFSYDYEAEFAGSGSVGPRGIVGRAVEAGQGWPADRQGGVDLIIGLACTVRGDAIDLKTPSSVIIGTIIFHVPENRIAPTSGGDSTNPSIAFDARQWDEYGAGGIPPIIPLGWVQNPYGPSGDSFLLGRIGPRNALTPGEEGNGGLCVFRVKREGNWGVRPVLMAGPDWVSEMSQTVGASLAWSAPPRTGEPAPGFEDLLIITRPAVDRSDRYSTVYMDADEASNAGYLNPPAGALGPQPYLRRSDRNAGAVWTGHRVETQGYTERATGMTPKTSSTHKVLMTMRWTLPGTAWDKTFP